MAQIIGGAILSAFGAGGVAGEVVIGSVAAGTAVTAATIVGSVVLTGASVAYGAYQSNKLKKELASQGGIDQGRQLMIRDSISPWRLIYGQVLVSGVINFFEETGTSREYIHIPIVLAAHEVEEIGTVYFNGTEVTLDGSGNATGTYAGFARVKKHRGEPGQVADADLIAECVGLEANFVGNRKAYLYPRLKANADLYRGDIPAITALVKGRKVYDPRDGSQDPDDPTTWKYSTNAALCVADFLHDKIWGKGVPWSRIVMAELITAANTCDEDVVLADGSTEKRYTVNGTILANEDPSAVLLELVAAMAGTVVDTGGVWTIRAGAYRAPSLNLTDSDIVGPMTVQPRQSRADTFNAVRGTYVSPINQWNDSDFPPIFPKLPATALTNGDRVTILIPGTTDFTLIGATDNNVGTMFTATGAGTGTGYVDPYMAQDGNIRLFLDMPLRFTTSPATAQRLAKIRLERGRQQMTVSQLTNLRAFECMPSDTITQSRDRYGWSSKEFEVLEWEHKQVGTEDAPAEAIQLLQQETGAAVWDWNDGEEKTVDLAPNTNLPDPGVVATPTGLTLLADDTTAFPQADGTFVPRLRVTWNLPNDIYVTEGGKAHLEYKKHTDSDWLVWNEQRGNQTLDYITDVLAGVAYDARLKFVNSAGVSGAYEEVDNYTVDLKAGTPSAPTGVTISADGVKPGYIPGTKLFSPACLVSWDPPSDPDYAFTEVKATFTDSNAAIDYTWLHLEMARETSVTIYSVFNLPGYVRVRHWNRTGVPSAWTAGGRADSNSSIGAGTVAQQNTDGVAVTKIQMGSGAKAIANLTPPNEVIMVTGGAPSESVNFDISSYGFSVKPDNEGGGFAANDPNVAYAYNWDDPGSTSSNAVLTVFTVDGSNLPISGLYRIMPTFKQTV